MIGVSFLILMHANTIDESCIDAQRYNLAKDGMKALEKNSVNKFEDAGVTGVC
jgi:hypothetical protein